MREDYQKALDFMLEYCTYECSPNHSACIAALQKQIQRQPIFWRHQYFDSRFEDDWGYECPCCGNRDIDYPDHHCICGQALDWSEMI